MSKVDKILFKLVIVISGLIFSKTSNSQNELLYSSTVLGQQFVNPSLNSLYELPVINVVSYQQWMGKMEGAPQTMALNAYYPLGGRRSGFGAGTNVIRETIGLRVNSLYSLFASHRLKLNRYSRLTLGVSVGYQVNSFEKSGIDVPANEQVIKQLDFSKENIFASIGVMYSYKWLHLGLSSNMLFDNEIKPDNLIPGFDAYIGGFYHLRRKKIKIMPRLAYSYYGTKEELNRYGNEVTISKSISIIDAGISVDYKDLIRIGASHRLDYSQLFSLDIILKKKFNIGYVYELGMGDVSEYNSQAIRLAISLSKKRPKNKYVNRLGL